METKEMTATVMSPEALLVHWQAHRGLTRRVIDAFPEKELFSYSVGGMRPFAIMAMEMIDLANIGMTGVVTENWKQVSEMPHHSGEGMPDTKEGVLALWDETTEKINRLWPALKPGRFQETTLSFGQYEGPVIDVVLYWVDNEIHHRGQGYVYLRSLGIEPPAFWDR